MWVSVLAKRKLQRNRKIEKILPTSKFEDDDVVPNQISFEDLFAEVDFSKSVDDRLESIVPSEEHAKKMASVTDAVVQNKSPKKKIWSFIFLVVNIVIVLFILLGMLEGDNVVGLHELTVNYWWLLAAFACFGVIMLSEQLRFMFLIKKSTKRRRPFLSYKTAAIGRYYDAITPLSTGGQPFQVYYLTKRGVKASSAISIPLAKYIIQQIVFTILSIVCIIGSVSFLKTDMSGVGSTIVSVACWVGFGLNFAVVFATLLISTSKLGHKLVIGVLKLLNKVRIVKDYDKYYAKLINIVEEYQRTIKFFAKSPKLLISVFFLSLVSIVAHYSVPFFIYCAFSLTFEPTLWLEMIVISLMIDLAASFIPLPGGSGVPELSFTALFMASFGPATFWALLLWRIITYYGFVVQGLVVTIYDYVYGNKKNARAQQKWELEHADSDG